MAFQFEDYLAVVEFTEPVLGSTPPRDVFTAFVLKKRPTGPAAGSESEDQEEVDSSPTEADLEGRITGFHQDDTGPFVYDYTWMGFLKECGNLLKDQLKIKNLRHKISVGCFVLPRRVRPDRGLGEALERPLRAQTAQGPRVTLASSDTLPVGTRMAFVVRVLKQPEVTPAVIRQLLEFGTLHGWGQWRTGGYGRFDLLRWEPVALGDRAWSAAAEAATAAALDAETPSGA